MMKQIGLIDVETGERGWIKYDQDAAGPIEFYLWFESKYVENRVRAYLSAPVEMAVQAYKPQNSPPLIDEGVEWRMMKPTTSADTFEVALRQMKAEVQVGLEPVTEE